MNVEEQVAVVWAGTNGHLDDVPVEDVRRFESEYLDFLRREHSGLFSSIVESGKLSEDAEGELESSMTAFKKQFAPSDDAGIRPGSDEADENTPELGRTTRVTGSPAAHRTRRPPALGGTDENVH